MWLNAEYTHSLSNYLWHAFGFLHKKVFKEISFQNSRSEGVPKSSIKYPLLFSFSQFLVPKDEMGTV